MKRFLLACISLLLSASAFGGDFSDFYSGFSQIFNSSIDPNAGMTVFPSLNIPSGGKYEGMGTAYTAVAREASFIEANPAASSVLKFSELSFSHNNWIADSKVEGVIFTDRHSNFGYGFAGKFLYLPFQSYSSYGDRLAQGYYSESIVTMNGSYNFFPSYYFHGLAVGGNLKVAYRHVPDVIYESQSVITAAVDLGVLTRFNLLKFYPSRDKNFSVGLTAKNIGLYALDEPLPMSAVAGIAYSPIRPLTLAFDFNYPFSFDYERYPAESWFVSTGMDLQFVDFFSVQSGFLLRSGNPRFSLGSTVVLEGYTIVANYTLDLTTQISSADRFSVQLKFNFGDNGRAERRKKAEQLYLRGLDLYARGELREAIDLWEEVLDLTPNFQPAQENLETARTALELQEEMEDRQEVE